MTYKLLCGSVATRVLGVSIVDPIRPFSLGCPFSGPEQI
jgi:hypothetical protein